MLRGLLVMILKSYDIAVFKVRARVDLPSRVIADRLLRIFASDPLSGDWSIEKVGPRKSLLYCYIGISIIVDVIIYRVSARHFHAAM